MIILFKTIKDPLEEFQVMVYIVTIVGVCLSVFYLIFVPERKLTKQSAYYDDLYTKKKLQYEQGEDDEPLLNKSDESNETNEEKPLIGIKERSGKTPGEWLQDGSFYLHGAIYMLVRLAMNLTMTVIPFYLNTIIKVPEPDPENGVSATIALVPLVSFIASAIFSLFFY